MVIKQSIAPIPRLEGVAGPLKEITLHGDTVICINIVFQLGVVIREVLSKRVKEREKWKEYPSVKQEK